MKQETLEKVVQACEAVNNDDTFSNEQASIILYHNKEGKCIINVRGCNTTIIKMLFACTKREKEFYDLLKTAVDLADIENNPQK